jgi:hypothetical protein
MRYILLIDHTAEACNGLSQRDEDVVLSVGGQEG